jgi:acyl-CoA thioesterase-1
VPANLPAPASGGASPTPAIAFPSSRPITYAAIGASDTVGVGAPNPATDGWVPRLHRRLPPGSRLVNLGISGARLRDAVQKELPKAIEAKPDLVTIWNVVNDLNANVDLASYERDLDKLLGDLIAKTPARLAVGNCPDLARVPAYIRAGIPADALRQEVGRWNGLIGQAVARHAGRAVLVDLYARSTEVDVDPSLVAGDDFHPSAQGYAQIAEVYWDFLVANRLVAG